MIVSSPWQIINRLSLKGKQVNQNAELTPLLEAVYNNHNLSLNGKVNVSSNYTVILFASSQRFICNFGWLQFIDSHANMVLTKKSNSQQKPLTLRMNTTWSLEDELIKVEGTIFTGFPGFSRIPWNLEITFIDSEEDENVWERLVRGEARLTNSQFILLNAALLPTKLNANVATPFQAYKSINLTIDYDRSTDSASTVAGELRINNDVMEFSANVDWPQDSTIPFSAHLLLNTPYEYEQLSLTWASEDPKTAAELSLIFNRKNQPNSFHARYNVASLDKIEADLKLERTIDSDNDNWSFQLISETSPDKLKGLLSLSTPLSQVKNVEISVTSAEKTQKASVILDTQLVTGKLQGSIIDNKKGGIAVDTSLEILQFCNFKLKTNFDRAYSDLNLDVFAVWDPTLVQWVFKTNFKRDGWRKYNVSSEMSSDSDRKWLLNLDLDFENVTSAYSHKIHYQSIPNRVLYSTYASFDADDTQYKGVLGADWGASRPIEVKFTSKTIAKKLGNIVAEIVTPWSEEQTAVIDVTVDARQQPTEFKVSAEIADRVVMINSNIKYNSLISMGIKTIGKLLLIAFKSK